MRCLFPERTAFHLGQSSAPFSAGRSEVELCELRQEVSALLTAEDLEIVYQPVIHLASSRVEFFEALSRFPSINGNTTDAWFAAAAVLGLSAEIEMLAVRCALKGLSSLPDGSTVSINLSPATILTPTCRKYLETAPISRMILEITEKDAVDCYEQLLETLKPLRARGLKIAVDDAGAGYSSFRHILHIRPDIIKLDMSICRNLNKDPMRLAFVSALVIFAREIGCTLVAEGVESTGELESLRRIGVCVVQGHVLARPLPLAQLSSIMLQAIPRLRALSHPLAYAA